MDVMVWENNKNAIGFYEKQGFEIQGKKNLNLI